MPKVNLAEFPAELVHWVPYDQFGVALNQVIRYGGHYYGIYHATDRKNWDRRSTNIAVSDDLVHWRK